MGRKVGETTVFWFILLLFGGGGQKGRVSVPFFLLFQASVIFVFFR